MKDNSKSKIPQTIRDAAINAQKVLRDAATYSDDELEAYLHRAEKMGRTALVNAAKDLIAYREYAKKIDAPTKYED